MRQLSPGGYGVRAWITMDGVGLASARGSYGLWWTTIVSPARQWATSVWDSISNDDASDDDGVFILTTLLSGC